MLPIFSNRKARGGETCSHGHCGGGEEVGSGDGYGGGAVAEDSSGDKGSGEPASCPREKFKAAAVCKGGHAQGI